jgi:hypothetical protein
VAQFTQDQDWIIDPVDEPSIAAHSDSRADAWRGVIDHRNPAIDATSGCARHRNPVIDHRATVIAARIDRDR